MEKMTYVKAIAYVTENCALPEEVAERLTALSASLVKKNSAVRKPTASQLANEGFKTAILEFLAEHAEESFSAKELAEQVAALADFNPQRVTGLLRSLDNAKRVVSVKEKRLNRYAIAATEEGEE
jgi:hypothetical protein